MEKIKGDPRHEEQQGPGSMHTEGPAAGYSLEEINQPIHSRNVQETMPKEKPKTK